MEPKPKGCVVHDQSGVWDVAVAEKGLRLTDSLWALNSHNKGLSY